MKRFGLLLFVLFSWFIFAALAPVYAADAAPAASSGIMAALLTNTVFPLLTALLLGLASYGLKLFATKYKLQILSDNNDLLMKVAAQGIAYAEEKAATFVDSRVPLNGNDKLTLAVKYITQALPKLTPDQAQNAVHAVIATIPGAGATGESAFVPGVVQTPPAQVVVS